MQAAAYIVPAAATLEMYVDNSQFYSHKFTRQSLGEKASFVETCFICSKSAAASGRFYARPQHWRLIVKSVNVL